MEYGSRQLLTLLRSLTERSSVVRQLPECDPRQSSSIDRPVRPQSIIVNKMTSLVMAWLMMDVAPASVISGLPDKMRCLMQKQRPRENIEATSILFSLQSSNTSVERLSMVVRLDV